MKRYPLPVTFLAGALLLALVPADAAAQRRGGPAHGGRSVVVVRPAYGPFYYGGFYDPFFWGYPGWYPYGFYAPLYATGPYNRPTGSARLQVTPRQAEVYVDGYLAGKADDFDGTFQRLHIRPGGHQITLYLDGHRSVTERLYFSPGKTQKIKMAMVPLAPGEAPQPRPVAPARTSPAARGAARDNSSQRPTS